jgi:hypothetical protein
MPDAFPATIAEREAELLALQGAFDEYIASSRELEEELDAELAKMRKLYFTVHFMDGWMDRSIDRWTLKGTRHHHGVGLHRSDRE